MLSHLPALPLSPVHARCPESQLPRPRKTEAPMAPKLPGCRPLPQRTPPSVAQPHPGQAAETSKLHGDTQTPPRQRDSRKSHRLPSHLPSFGLRPCCPAAMSALTTCVFVLRLGDSCAKATAIPPTPQEPRGACEDGCDDKLKTRAHKEHSVNVCFTFSSTYLSIIYLLDLFLAS